MMKRRKLIRYAGAGLLATLGMGFSARWQPTSAQSNNRLSIKWLGHTCFLFTGGGRRILVNPFRRIGCTAKYRDPNVVSDLVMISSQLLDEGVVEGLPGSPKLLYQPGVYELDGFQVQGIGIPHDREGGRRFGTNVAWLWTQAGVRVLHLGGAASPISFEQKILMGRPDVMLVPVGGGPKAYGPQEAAEAVRTLNPKMVIPTHYRTQAADPEACDIVALDEFLALMEGLQISRLQGDGLSVQSTDLKGNVPLVRVLSYKF